MCKSCHYAGGHEAEYHNPSFALGYGHPVGDDVLVVVAQRLSAAMRDGDLLARLGGDEFGVIARHLAGAEAATSIANRILKALESLIEVGSVRHRVGAGIGLALVPDDGTTAEEILRKADIALYRAKAGIQSAARFFEEEMDRHSRERESLERDLAAAIEAGTICPWYQPIVELKTHGHRCEAMTEKVVQLICR